MKPEQRQNLLWNQFKNCGKYHMTLFQQLSKINGQTQFHLLTNIEFVDTEKVLDEIPYSRKSSFAFCFKAFFSSRFIQGMSAAYF